MLALKVVCTFVIFCGILACLLVSYSYIGGDRADREDMHATFASFIQNVHPNAVHEASLSSLDSSN